MCEVNNIPKWTFSMSSACSCLSFSPQDLRLWGKRGHFLLAHPKYKVSLGPLSCNKSLDQSVINWSALLSLERKVKQPVESHFDTWLRHARAKPNKHKRRNPINTGRLLKWRKTWSWVVSSLAWRSQRVFVPHSSPPTPSLSPSFLLSQSLESGSFCHNKPVQAFRLVSCVAWTQANAFPQSLRSAHSHESKISAGQRQADKGPIQQRGELHRRLQLFFYKVGMRACTTWRNKLVEKKKTTGLWKES